MSGETRPFRHLSPSRGAERPLSKARTLPRQAFLGDLAAHAGKESALGREAARAQRRDDAAHVRRVARGSNGIRHSRDPTSDRKKTPLRMLHSWILVPKFRSEFSEKSRHADRDSSPYIPGIWQ